VIRFKDDIMKEVRSQFEALLEDPLKYPGYISIDEEQKGTYDFTSFDYALDLFVFGGGSFTMKASGSINQYGEYFVTLEFTIFDAFADVLDPMNKIDDKYGWLDFDGCLPYWLTGSWTEQLYGRLEKKD